MSKNDTYYHVYSATMDGCDLTKEADAMAKESWLCTGCNSPKPGVGAIDVMIRAAPGTESLNAAIGWGIPIASRACLHAFGDDLVQRELFIGRVLDQHGKEYIDWATFRGRHRVIVRGTKHACTRKCPECGRDIYFAMDKKYLYPAPSPDVSLFESDMCGLVLS